MPTYAEFLKLQGATEDDIKVLDTPVGRKAFDKLQADATAAVTAAANADRARVDYEAQSNKWHDEVNTSYLTMKDQLVVAQANEAKARAVIIAARDQGLIKVADDLGYVTAPPAAAAPPPGTFDPNKYFNKDDVVAIAMKEAEAIALAQDIAAEHGRLFPGVPLSFRELHRDAVARKISVEALWKERYKVDDARTARATADKDAYEKRLREEGAAAARSELASQYGNPDTRPLSTSQSPFAPRPAASREKQPWESGTDGDNGSNDRVQRATKSLIERQARPN